MMAGLALLQPGQSARPNTLATKNMVANAGCDARGQPDDVSLDRIRDFTNDQYHPVFGVLKRMAMEARTQFTAAEAAFVLRESIRVVKKALDRGPVRPLL